MKKIKVNTTRSYFVYIGENAVDKFAPYTLGANKMLIVYDRNFYDQNTEKAEAMFSFFGGEKIKAFLDGGELNKDLSTVKKLFHLLLKNNFSKSDFIVAVGGGTVCDLVGFTASVYRRGISYVNIPTTLISMVDTCVGGKTSINYDGIKNALGTTYQPTAVFIDTFFLQNLSDTQTKDGVTEIIKYAVIGSRSLFANLSKKGYIDENSIYLALKVKVSFVEKDEWDRGVRRVLNLGHTFSYAIESASGYAVSSGDAVAQGIALACKFSENIFGSDAGKKINDLFNKYRIDTTLKTDKKELEKYILSDKKIANGKINLVLPKKIGKCEVVPFTKEEFEKVFYGN